MNIYNYRHTTGTTWTQASTRIQYSVDVTNKAYIEFNPPGNSSDPGGIGIYTASTTGLVDNSGGITIKRNGNVAIGKTTANATLDISGSISYSNYYFKFVGSNSLAITNGASIGFTNSTGTPYYNSGYTQGRYFLAPVTGYYHLSYSYNIAGTNGSWYIGFITSASDPTGFLFNTGTWTNSNILAMEVKEFVASTQLNGTITTNAYLTSGQRVYVVVASGAGANSSMYSWGNPATNVWTGYLISQ